MSAPQPIKDITLTCDSYTCDKKVVMKNLGTPTHAEFHFPLGWILVRESLGDGESEESIYCSHECLRTVENDD